MADSHIIRSVLDSLAGWRAALAAADLPAERAALLDRLDALLADLRRLAGEDGPADPRSRFDRVRQLDQRLDAIARQWAGLRAGAGVAAAEAILAGADVEAGWRRRWGGLSAAAWGQRRDERLMEEQFVNEEPPPPVVTAKEERAFDHLFAADLRYGAGLALQEIADLLFRSTSAVQARLASFEDRVFLRAAEDMAQEQLREADTPWSAEFIIPPATDSDEAVPPKSIPARVGPFPTLELHHRRDPWDGPKCLLPILAARPMSDGAGRRTAQPNLARLAESDRRIVWVALDDARARFIPHKRLLRSAQEARLLPTPTWVLDHSAALAAASLVEALREQTGE